MVTLEKSVTGVGRNQKSVSQIFYGRNGSCGPKTKRVHIQFYPQMSRKQFVMLWGCIGDLAKIISTSLTVVLLQISFLA